MKLDSDILILSPHLDDAALSCADHIADWRSTATKVTVDTIFSDFSAETASPYQQKYINMLNFKSCRDYGYAREKEDILAMKMLDVNYHHANFTDAGFRMNGQGQSVYPSYRALTPFKLDCHCELLLNALTDYLESYKDVKLVLVPAGVGGHIDHVLVREAAKSVFRSQNTGYYIEFPYGLRFWKYRLSMFKLIKHKRLSRKFITEKKRRVLNLYQTQINNLFKKTYSYSELLFLPQVGIYEKNNYINNDYTG